MDEIVEIGSQKSPNLKAKSYPRNDKAGSAKKIAINSNNFFQTNEPKSKAKQACGPPKSAVLLQDFLGTASQKSVAQSQLQARRNI